MCIRDSSGLAVAWFPLAKSTGLVHTFATAADRLAVRRILTALCVLLAVCLVAAGGLCGGGMVLAAVLVFVRYRRMSQKEFGGISGDLAGWFLQKTEIWMLAALVVCQMVEEW